MTFVSLLQPSHKHIIWSYTSFVWSIYCV